MVREVCKAVGTDGKGSGEMIVWIMANWTHAFDKVENVSVLAYLLLVDISLEGSAIILMYRVAFGK